MKSTPTNSRLTAINAARTPRMVSVLTRFCVWLFLIIPPILLITPWQQNIRASGKVTAFAPIERQQTIEAPIGGRLVKWFVKEGAKVKADEVLAEIADVDPELLSRLTQQLDAAKLKLSAKKTNCVLTTRKLKI